MWSILALEDRQAIFDYVAADRPSAAIRLDDRIRSGVVALEMFPKMGRKGRVVGSRELAIRQTPYIAAYRITDDIEILRVLHGAQVWPSEL